MIDGKEVFFGHNGSLYYQCYMMYEKTTESLFGAVTGLGMVGKYRGVKLQQYPSVLTTWCEWKKHYPKTKVMKGRSTGGMMGTYTGASRPSGLILTLDVEGKTSGCDMAKLAAKKVVNDSFNGRNIAWISLDSGTTLVLDRTSGGKTLTLEKWQKDEQGRETLKDKETGSTWLPLSGECVEGELKGKKLYIHPTTPFKQRRWKHFHRKGDIRDLDNPEKPKKNKKFR